KKSESETTSSDTTTSSNTSTGNNTTTGTSMGSNISTGSNTSTTQHISNSLTDKSFFTVNSTAAGSVASAVVAEITSQNTDADPSGSEYRKLCLKSTKQTKNSITISYKKVSGAVKYIVLANKCGKNNKYQMVKTTTEKTLTFKKIAGKKVKKGTYYKFIVIAVDKNGNVISTSKTIHIATKGGKVGNTKKITVKNLNTLQKTMSVGTARNIKIKLTNPSGVKVKTHRKVCYESSDKNVATVNISGKITAKGKGTCYIYVYTQNGLMKKIKITVK
ncbi:MAG: hypothetical protein ACI39F_02265, partial [Acutalibacteraceae bacterium]